LETKLRKAKAGHRLWRSLALLAGIGLAVGQARADGDSPWRRLADAVFRPVAQNADLPHALIPISIVESSTGFLWLGGDGGLLRWDGYAFRDYPAEPGLPGGLRGAEILTLHRDAAHHLWAGTKANGLARYDPGQDRLICVPLRGQQCGGLSIRSIEDDGAGGIWVGSTDGLFRLNADRQVISEAHHDIKRPASLPGDGVSAILRDRHGVVWVGTAAGLVRTDDQGRTFAPVALTGGAADAVSHMLEDSAGRLWVGTRQQGAYMIDAARGPARLIPATAPFGAADTATEITAITEIAPDRIWLGTDGAGIIEVDGTTLQSRRIVHNPLVPNSLDGDSVQALYRDASGLVWVGTEDGLSEYNPGAGIITLFGHQGRRDGLPGASAQTLLAAPGGSIWAGLQGEGYVVLDPGGRRATGLPGHRVFASAPAPGGGVLLGTDGGLFLADPSGNHVTRLQIPQVSPTIDIRMLHVANGAVWLGAREGGLWELHLDAHLDAHGDPQGTVTVLRFETAPRLTNARVEAIGNAPGGRIAVGTEDGLNLLDPATTDIERIGADPTNPQGLDSGLVDTFAIDHRGRLWVGTNNGLDVLVGHDARGKPIFRRIGMADGLPNLSIDSLLVDRNGSIWASTDMGLAVVNPTTFMAHALQRADGVAITNYWNESAVMTQQGDLMFGGIGGITVVHPQAALQWNYHPPVVVTAARIGGRPARITPNEAPLLVVPPDANSLDVEFAALDFSAPAHNRYRYQLDGFDLDWTETDAEHRVAAYTNLPPGDYTLHLAGSNRNGVWTTPETTLQIRVLAAWYQTLWCRLAAAAMAVLALVALLRGWTAILRRRQRELERQVAERTGELSISKLQLQHANAALELRVMERTQALVERTAALEASEARFRAWFNNAEDAVFIVQVEPDGSFVFEAVNAAVERVFGFPAAAYAGRQPDAVFPPEYAAEIRAQFGRAAQGATIQVETRFVWRGEERLLDSWIVPLRHPVTGRVGRLVGATRDMTAQRALEARLAQAQKLQALGGLAGGIAHDFNNILQAVAGAAMLIEQRPDDHERTTRLARNTIAAAERGTSITRRLLAFARSDELRVEAMQTAEVLEGISDVLTYTLGSTVTVCTSFASRLPPLLADRGQLETVLVNLGTNARDAMQGCGVLKLSAEPEQVADGAAHPAGLLPGSYVRIDVADSGCGMDAATIARSVEPFFTTKPPVQGTGLGLALVKGFAEQSGGGMTIESTPGVGTTVSLWLRQAAPDALQRAAAPPGGRDPSAANARILVVDDDELVRETMAEQLEGGGFQVMAAASGAEALARLESAGAPDALVCDLSMPGMNGIDTIKRARDLFPGLPCFLLTGYAGERAALETGNAFTLLRKPISANALIAHIDAGLAASRQ